MPLRARLLLLQVWLGICSWQIYTKYSQGGSSGIGLSTVELLLSLGASVVSGDIQSSSTQASPAYLFVQTDVTSWTDLATLFKTAKQHFGRIDSVFANAGIGPRANYLALKTDSDGDLKEPTHAVLDINLKSTINTATLALHYLKQQSEGGSLVIMGSSTGLQPLRAPDYCKSTSYLHWQIYGPNTAGSDR